jgi:hypothetical protein
MRQGKLSELIHNSIGPSTPKSNKKKRRHAIKTTVRQVTMTLVTVGIKAESILAALRCTSVRSSI